MIVNPILKTDFGKLKIENNSPIFLIEKCIFVYLLVFLLDCLSVYFFNVPIYLAFLPLFFLTFIVVFNAWNFLFGYLLLFACFLKSIMYGFAISDIGYFISFSVFLLTSFYFVRCKFFLRTGWLIFLFFVSSLFYFSYFLGFDNIINNADLSALGADPEYYRSYHAGLFRAPHFPSYLFYFLGLFFFFNRKSGSKTLTIIILFLCALVVITSGARTPIVALGLSLVICNFRTGWKGIVVWGGGICSIFLITVKIESIMTALSGTIFYQYFSIIYTVFHNFDRLSRIQITKTFFKEISEFNLSEHILGRSFSASLYANKLSLGEELWFHNDFFAIYFSYGFVGLAFFVYAFYYMYKNLNIKDSCIVSRLFYFSLIIVSAFNGLIYHAAIFYIYLLTVISVKSPSKL